MSDVKDPPNGVAARRYKTCLTGEKNCGSTLNGFTRCCPGSTICHGKDGTCCEKKGACKYQFRYPNQCANETWHVYENGFDGGHFCCDKGANGLNLTGGVGCLSDKEYYSINSSSSSTLFDGVNWLLSSTIPGKAHIWFTWQCNQMLTNLGAAPTPTTDTLTPVSATATSTSGTDPDGSSSSSGSNSGAIAGGVVGGVAGIAIFSALLWYIIRRRSLQQPHQEGEVLVNEASMSQKIPSKDAGQPSELSGHQVHEMESPRQLAHELPGSPATR